MTEVTEIKKMTGVRYMWILGLLGRQGCLRTPKVIRVTKIAEVAGVAEMTIG